MVNATLLELRVKSLPCVCRETQQMLALICRIDENDNSLEARGLDCTLLGQWRSVSKKEVDKNDGQ